MARSGSAFAASDVRFHDLSKGAVTAARDALLADGHLIRGQDGAVSVVDPLFADWLRRAFP